jgi:hypothetical protein
VPLLKPVPLPMHLQAAVDACATAGLPAETTAGLLAIFDATRFAVLVCEQAAAATSAGEEEGAEGGGGSGGDGGGSGGGGGPMAGVDHLLALAHASLALPGAVPTGLALLEGVLTLQPASYMAAALQLGLACGADEARRGVLSMLCRVPVELLPPAVLADALAQLAEAVDCKHLAPPFLPYELLGRLYGSPHLMHSMQTVVERGPDAAAAAAAAEVSNGGGAAAQELWTVRVSGCMEGAGSDASTAAAARAAAAAASGGGSSSSSSAPQATAGGQGQERQGGRALARGLLLLPLQATGEPLHSHFQRLLEAILSCLLRRAGGTLDAVSLR